MKRPLRVIAWPAGTDRDQNPYTALLYSAIRRRGVGIDRFTRLRLLLGRHDILHVHWPEVVLRYDSWLRAAYRATTLIVLLTVARLQRTHVVWTVHNLAPHESTHPGLERWYRRAFFRRVDAVLSLSNAGLDELGAARLPGLQPRCASVIHHGHYGPAYADAPSKAAAREQLGIDASARVVLFLGAIRSYKGTEQLVRTFRKLRDADARLLVAGRPADRELEDQIRDAAAGDERIELRLGFVDDELVPVLIAAADLLALPYRRVLNSGSALLGLTFGTPVLVPATPTFHELAQLVGEEWVRTYDGPLTAEALEAPLRSPALGTPDLSAFDWDVLAAQTIDAYLEVAGRDRVGVPSDDS